MDQEHRDNIKAANRRRGNCLKCGADKNGLAIRDGSEIGGLPGIKYRCCNGCGWTQAITHRQRRFKL